MEATIMENQIETNIEHEVERRLLCMRCTSWIAGNTQVTKRPFRVEAGAP